ncbi:MAG: hypothetical protein EBR82_77935, partial [Caulobacteraceae bacterium]|nr:hypothetical protein [Caulobacteraceae bacterium]
TLSYDEIINYASTNKLNLSDVVNYIGTEDKRADLLSGLQSYVQDKEFTSGLSGSTVTDNTGKQYAASDLLSLAKQIKSNFDLNNSSGSVYKTQGANIGFAYEEAAKLFPNGNPTVLDQVTVDMARNLLNQGISSVEELSKYKPTQVTEQTPNPEGGGNLETVVTKYIDPETGKELSLDGFGAAYAGKGGTIYNARIDASGKPVFGTVFTDTSDRQQIGALVTFAAAVFAPQILPELIGSSVSGIELAALGGEMAAGTGLTGALIGAGVPASVAGYAATAIVNGVYNGVVTEINGGDFTKGFINGGVAPVIGQIATNAVNSITSGLPTGVSNAVGNAVTQLISTGEIDLGQMALAGVKPSAINTIVEASGGALTAPQARVLFDTVASGGQNIISLAQNPGAVVNFVMRNQDVFNNTATAAVTGTSQKPAVVDLTPLDSVQKELLVNNTRVETPQGQSLFQ